MKTNKYPPNPILLVDDEKQFLKSCDLVLRSSGFNNVVLTHNSREALPLLQKDDFGLMALDINMPYLSGKEILEKAVQDFPDLPIIMLTGVDEIATAVECMKIGAFDYMVKPVEGDRLVSSVKRAIEYQGLKQENSNLKKHLLSDSLEHPEFFSEIVTINKTMRSIFQYIESIAGTTRPVLIIGDTGVGKELIAKSIHSLSGREGNFVPVNVGGLDDNIFSDTLFGHKKGAFTGADQPRGGLIERGEGGTLFLDEIGDLEPPSQVKLLRLLQEGEYYPLGSDFPKVTNARILASTNRDLRKLQKEGKFRNDLYYRLKSHHIKIPSLHDRFDDMPLLIEHFLKEASFALGKKKPSYPKELLLLLSTFAFPGNIRELQSLIFDAVSKHKRGTLSLNSFREYIAQESGITNREFEKDSDPDSEFQLPFTLSKDGRFPTLKEAEGFLIKEAMKRSQENQTVAAQMLGLSRPALNKRLHRKS